MLDIRSKERCRLTLCCILTLAGIAIDCSHAWTQTDITDATLPHTSDSVIFDWLEYYAPENVSNNALGLYYGSWHSGDERTGQPFPHWVAIDFGTPRIVGQLNVLAFSEAYDADVRLKDFRFEGSDDGISYTPLHQNSLQYANLHEWQSYDFENAVGYRYYRLYGLSNWAETDVREQMIIEEWEMFETAPTGVSNPADATSIIAVSPNPVATETRIRVNVASPEPVELAVYGPSGGLIRTLVRDVLATGVRSFRWDTTNQHGQPVASGLYFCSLRAGTATSTVRVFVTR